MKTWQDTVIPVLSHSESIWCPHCGKEFGIESKVQYEREAQAEATWKERTKRIAEWGEEDCPHFGFALDHAYKRKHNCSECWQELEEAKVE